MVVRVTPVLRRTIDVSGVTDRVTSQKCTNRFLQNRVKIVVYRHSETRSVNWRVTKSREEPFHSPICDLKTKVEVER